jgi:hypothetical protein
MILHCFLLLTKMQLHLPSILPSWLSLLQPDGQIVRPILCQVDDESSVYVCHIIEIRRVTRMMTVLMQRCIVATFYKFIWIQWPNWSSRTSTVATRAFYSFYNNQPPLVMYGRREWKTLSISLRPIQWSCRNHFTLYIETVPVPLLYISRICFSDILLLSFRNQPSADFFHHLGPFFSKLFDFSK